MPYRIEYSPDALDHLTQLSVRDQKIILQAVDVSLSHQPYIESRNRKPMRPNPVAPWELRIGNLRVYFEVAEGSEPLVLIRAVGVKERNVVRIGGEVWEL